ncbi:hypothetical protein [Butyrivibrio sp. INlla16]|uniref:hypothetical protein n=1 Tax=Butyrivibrio sp. INlla16 TaxID=1520807 RepID=UPI0008924CCD|nr:hypothetical protein [Butyrivibrio sp. INlla16]SDB19020.1 hypothetical protein SAMN02910263_00901 [Butyrivibrio sp. INlla16]
MDYDYLSSIVSNYSNLTSLNSMSGGLLGGSSALGSASALASIGSSLDTADATSALASANSFSSILGMVMKSDLLGQTASSEDSAEAIVSDLSKEAEDRLIGIAGAASDGTAEGEARSNLILQNYLYTAMMKDSIDNSLTDKADFTSGLFSNLAVGSEDGEGNSALSALTDTALSAIGNYSGYKSLLDNSSEDLQSIVSSVASGSNNRSSANAISSSLGSDVASLDTSDEDSIISSYTGQGSLLREMLNSLSSDLMSTSVASQETRTSDRSIDSHLRSADNPNTHLRLRSAYGRA